MPKNLISPVVKARSNEVSPAVVVVIYLDINANNEPDSVCSGKRSTQQIGGEGAVGCRRHENRCDIPEPKLDFSSILDYFHGNCTLEGWKGQICVRTRYCVNLIQIQVFPFLSIRDCFSREMNHSTYQDTEIDEKEDPDTCSLIASEVPIT